MDWVEGQMINNNTRRLDWRCCSNSLFHLDHVVLHLISLQAILDIRVSEGISTNTDPNL